MSLDDARATLGALWSPLLALTTRHAGQANGQIIVAALPATLLREAPRVVIEVWRANFTHDLLRASGVFALHLLAGAPGDALDRSLDLVRGLGLRSGRDGDKLAGVAYHDGVTGSPILRDALSVIEARVVAAWDGGEVTFFLADVVAAAVLGAGEPLTMLALRSSLPPADVARWDANTRDQQARARAARGAPQQNGDPA